VRYREIIADNLSKAGWSWGCVAAVDSNGRTIFVADAHRDDGWRYVVRAEEKLTAFVELEAAIRESGLRNESERPVGLRFGGCKWQTIPPSL
jgi:tRNA/tmRNA/rRNA uracil-C5-methylase (TrmA/RlmC/RlmD family)